MRFRPDATWRQAGTDLIAGSPLKIFRLTDAGGRVTNRIHAGEDVGPSRLVDRLVGAGAIHPLPDAATFTLDDVTIVTPLFGGTAIPDRLTIDDGSRPPVVGATIRLDHNQGPAAARNAARPHVNTELIAFVDVDVDLLDDVAGSWLRPLLGHFDDPRVGLVAPRVCGEYGSPLDLGPDPARIRAQTRVSYVPAAAIVVRRAAFDAVGGFDEALRLGEDVDFVWRLDAAGWDCRYEPDSVVWHRPRPTLRGRLRQHQAYGSSAAALALRHPTLLAPWHADPITAVAWTAIAVGAPPAVLGATAYGLRSLHRQLPGFDAAEVITLFLDGQVRIARQLCAALRREWWPLAAVAGVTMRPVRRLVALAIVVAPRRVLTDIAYGTGVWMGMWRHRTLRPIIPRLLPSRR